MRNPRRATCNRYSTPETDNRWSGRQENSSLSSSSSYRRSGNLSIEENSYNRRSRDLSVQESSSSPEGNRMAIRNVTNNRPQGEYEDRTIIVENIRADSLLHQLHKLFSRHGRVLNLRIENPHDPNLPGCSKDGLLARSEGCEFGGMALGIYAIVEYCTHSQAFFAMSELRCMMTDPYHRDGFRAGWRSMYSYVETKMDEPTTEDMEIGASGEPRNTNMREERLTEEVQMEEY